MANTAGTQASIGNGQTMNADAAIYWRLLVAVVFAACGAWVVATEGTRTYARQLFLWQNRNKPGYNPAYHPDSPYAYHLSGRAVDVGSGVGFILTLVSIAFYKLAGDYGFRATVKGEPWHFEWRLEWVAAHIRAMVGTTPASSGASPITPSQPQPQSQEDDMFNDTDRAWLKDVRAALTQEAGGGGKENPGIRGTVDVLARDAAAPDPQAVHKLVRIKNKPDVFHSVDFHTLRGIPSEKVLDVLGWQLQQIGALDTRAIAKQVITVDTIDDLKGFGALIGPRPLGVDGKPNPFYAAL